MKSLSAIILAAGKGTRMKSDLPKVVHEVAGRPMVCWVIEACLAAGCGRVVVVVGYKQEDVRRAVDRCEAGGAAIEFALQAEQLGTGHAVMCAESLFEAEKREAGHGVFVLAGDGPLIRAETLSTILKRHEAGERAASATLATSTIEDPTGYGRIIRDTRGDFMAIVEEKNAEPWQKDVKEVNPSYYCFDARDLFESLRDVQRNPVSGEYYVTDVPSLLMERGRRVEVIDAVPSEDVLSINTLEQLAEVDGILRERIAGRTERRKEGARSR